MIDAFIVCHAGTYRNVWFTQIKFRSEPDSTRTGLKSLEEFMDQFIPNILSKAKVRGLY